MVSGRLQGKVALISGAARGMGAAFAARFANEGAIVVIGDVLEGEGERAAAELRGAGHAVSFVRLDVTDPQQWNAAVEKVVDDCGALHVLVNNAGVSDASRLVETSDAAWDRVVDINQRGVFLGMRAGIPAIAHAGGGAVVNVSSVLGIRGKGGYGAYHASKAAIVLMTQSAAADHAADGVRVNAVCPGLVLTPLLAAEDQAAVRALTDRLPMRRGADPAEIANGVLFLASDEASFVTGCALVMDGGQLVM